MELGPPSSREGRKRLLLELKEALFHSEGDERMQRRGREGSVATSTRACKYGRNQGSWGPSRFQGSCQKVVASATAKGKGKMKWMALSLPLNALPSTRCTETGGDGPA